MDSPQGDTFVQPLDEPSSDALHLLGGQTGSDARESAGPCGVEVVAEYDSLTPTPLGFSGGDVAASLTARELQLRWADAAPVTVQLGFSADLGSTAVARILSGTAECIDVLRLNVAVTLSSAEPRVSGTWATRLYARAPGELAGTGLAGRNALGATLIARSGDAEALRLTYALVGGSLEAWLLNGEVPRSSDVPPEVVAELSER